MIKMNELDRVEILTLLDNYIDMTVPGQQSDDPARRGLEEGEVRKSIHLRAWLFGRHPGRRRASGRGRCCSIRLLRIGAAYNAKALEVPIGEIEAIALSHGHGDHRGGFRNLVGMIGRHGVEFVAHPAVFREHRYSKVNKGEFKSWHPPFTRRFAEEAGDGGRGDKEPRPMLGGDVLFLGEIPRRTEFETGLPTAFYEENGIEKKDALEDDTSIVMNLKGKGIIVLFRLRPFRESINTVRYAREVTGIETVHAIMGGFHLGIPSPNPMIGVTISEFQQIDPRYIVPTHCTGRKSIQKIEAAMPRPFYPQHVGDAADVRRLGRCWNTPSIKRLGKEILHETGNCRVRTLSF